MWFRKDIADEIIELIRAIGVKDITINEEWQYQNKKFRSLRDLEELDLKIIRDIQILHTYNRDNPALSEKIITLALELKRQLTTLLSLSKLASSIPKQNIELAKKILKELEILLREEVREERLIPGMTWEQIQKFGIQVRSFYSVQSYRGTGRLLHGKGEWPISPTKSHLGPGVYAWDTIGAAQQYKENIIRNVVDNGEIPKPLHIIKITFSETSLRKFKPLDVDLLDNFKTGDTEEWMKKHSSLWTSNAKRHGYKYVIRGVSPSLGREHYFHPDCLQEAIVEIAA